MSTRLATPGLLSRLHPTGGAGHSPFATDGGGAAQAVDGGGSAKSKMSGLMLEALRRSNAGLRQPEDETLDNQTPDDARRLNQVTARPGFAAGNDPVAHFWRWEVPVRQELLRSRLMSALSGFGSLQVSMGGQALLTLTNPRDAVEKDAAGTVTWRLLKDEAAQVRRRADQREDRQAEILMQADDLWPFWQSLTHVEFDEAPRTRELLGLALQLGTSVVMQLKHEIACPRPSDVSPGVMPMIPVPGHGSFPSGHAMSAALLSALMGRLLELKAAKPSAQLLDRQLQRLALRVARNREVAGVHFSIDSAAGELLGQVLADALAVLAGQAGEVNRATFDAAKLRADGSKALARRRADVDLKDVAGAFIGRSPVTFVPPAPPAPPVTPPQATQQPDELLAALWTAAQSELDKLGLSFR